MSLDMPQMLAATGATYRQLDLWTRCQYIHADTYRADRDGHSPGSGVSRSWPETEADVCRLMVTLAAAGVRPECGGPIARGLLSAGRAKVAPGMYLVNGEMAS